MRRWLCVFVCFSFFLISACSDNKQQNDNLMDVIASVNGELIFRSEIDPVYEEYKDANITYDKIVEDTINEILVIQQAPKYNIMVSESEIDDSILIFNSVYPDLYKELQETYTENEIRKKLKDRLLFTKTRDYALENIIPITREVIINFEQDNNLSKQLEGYTDEQIIASLKTELEEYSLKCWVLELRKSACIEYF